MRQNGYRVMALALMLLGLTGCSSVLPDQLQGKLDANGSADDHMVAAMLYQNEAKRLDAEADRYEQRLASIGASADPKGFHRESLRIAAEESRRAAEQMQTLYASHFERAQTMYGMKQPE